MEVAGANRHSFFVRRRRFSWLIGQNASSGQKWLKTQQTATSRDREASSFAS